MAKTKSAKKRVEVIRKRTERNRRLKSALRTAIKRFEEALATGAAEEAQTRLRRALVAIDKAVTKGILHRNTAARKKSRLMRKMNAAG
ncbi:MAG: 30S ribosomal protein S20 [Desulfotomaculales bacterium]